MINSCLAASTLSIIIPAYNDETTVGQLIKDVNSLVKTLCPDYEILSTNDGSKDSTLAVLQELATPVPNLRIINHETNQGYGRTIKELYLSSTKDLVFSLPGDYQYAPKELITMAQGLKDYDLVIGLRVKRNDPLRRKLQSHVYNLMLRTVYGISFKDVNSIKLFRRAVLDKITLISETPFVDAELCIRAHRAGFRIGELPVEHLPRLSQGASGGRLSVILETFSDLIEMKKSL